MSEESEQEDKEVDTMEAIKYDKQAFLAELESSLKEMVEKKNKKDKKLKQSSWRKLFTMDAESRW
jgi:hypothetical protein